MDNYTLTFTKDGQRTITYHHDNDGLYFEIEGYPSPNRIYTESADLMNLMMNLLSEAGYSS